LFNTGASRKTAGIEATKVIRYKMPATNDVFLVGPIVPNVLAA
jgi:hypothetical protein